VKPRQESIAAFREGRREDLVAQEQAEIDVLERCLPRQLSAVEIRAEAQSVITEIGATNPRDMGRVMRELMPPMCGQADGRQVSQIVRELLAGQG